MSGISTKITAYFAIFFTLQLSLIVATIKAENNRPVETRRPNTILFVGDDFGYGDLSVYGHPTQEWGAIDEMAINGIRFTQFYATSIFCSPSRAAILTGKNKLVLTEIYLYILYGHYYYHCAFDQSPAASQNSITNDCDDVSGCSVVTF